MKSKTKKNELDLKSKLNSKEILAELNKEIEQEYYESVKNKAKELIKNIKRTQILLEKQQEELESMFNKSNKIKEEDLLFD